MNITVDGQKAYLKEGTSFDFISENSLFTGSDSYTLTISFPLKDCPQNMAIFGRIHRKDVDKEKISFDCEIRDKDFYKVGSLTVTGIDEVEVKTQFLEGRSIQNFEDTFDEIYLNELSLGYNTNRSIDDVTPANAWVAYPDRNDVALPWVNNTSGNLQNEVVKENGVFVWKRGQVLSYQPYLIYILKKICQQIGYSYDFSQIENSEMKYLLICNTLPPAWGIWNYAIALPHWTLTEFFEELEKLLLGEFKINHGDKSITFEFTKVFILNRQTEYIDKVVNEYTTEVSQENDCEYVGLMNVKYAENNNRFWPYRDCQWYIREHASEATVFSTLAALLTFAQTLKESGVYTYQSGGRTMGKYIRGYEENSDGHKLFYAEDVDEYFIMFCYDSVEVATTSIREDTYHWYKYFNRLEPVNQFGKLEVEKEADDIEIKIVPAWIDETEEELGRCIFLECGEMGSVMAWDEGEQNNNTPSPYGNGFGGARTGNSTVTDETDYNDGAVCQAKTGKAIEKGEKEESEEYFDKIYVGYWDGTNRDTGKMPYPFTHTIETRNDFTSIAFPYTLSLERSTANYDRKIMNEIDGKQKYNFSWLADNIPDVRTVFNIKGKNYLCEKITASFSEKGRSRLLKGVFYRLI